MKKKISFSTKTKYLEHKGVDLDSVLKVKQEKFQESSKRERWALDKIKHFLIGNLQLGFDYLYNPTPEFGYDVYDAIFTLCEEGTPKHTWFIECKVREQHYPKLMMEKKKLQDIKSIIQTPNSSIMYICFTREGTFIYNMSKIEKEHPEEMGISYIQCPRQTMGDKTPINKPVYLLDTNLAKKINFIYNEQEYLQDQQQKKSPDKKHSECPLFGKI
jgi:hypothetical protein